jgi:formylglycine-generating enzyme required for sulfatase activity
MDAFAADYLANLTADLTSKMLSAAGRLVSSRFVGTEREQALERCVYLGMAAMLARARDLPSGEKTYLQGILRCFFANPETGGEVGQLLRGNALPVDNLLLLFEQAGYDRQSPAGIDLREGLRAFEIAFLAAATEEETLRGTLEVSTLLGQKRVMEEMLEELRRLNRLLQQGWSGTRADTITEQSVVVGVQQLFGGGMATTEDWEKHYLLTLIGQCDELDLAAVDETVSLREGEGVRVSDVFTQLYLDRLTRGPKQKVATAILKPDQGTREEREKRLPIQAIEAVAALPRLVILGQPGGGKSTLVNHMAVQLAKRRLGQTVTEEKLPGWVAEDKPLPVRIILRRLAAWLPATAKRGTAGLVWDYLEQQLRDSGCTECFTYLKRVLTDEGGVLFCDGLDEVYETDEDAKRSLIKEALLAFAKPLTKCRVVITCREYAYRADDAWRLPVSQFPVVELALFNTEQIAEFITTWYRVVAGPHKGWNTAKCQDEAADLVKTIQGSAHLQDLARYPLLLTLMAQVHGRDGKLPNNRADLYERAVNLLLEHWENRIVIDGDKRRRVEPGLVAQLEVRVETLRLVLERLAFEAHDRQEGNPQRGESAADIPREDLREALEAALGDANKANQAIAYIQQRAGLLVDKGRRTFAFPHKTFQEYLAATHIMRQSEPERILRERVWRDLVWWREVFLLAAGSVRRTPSNIYKLVDFLLPREPCDAVPPQESERARLAEQAFWETGFAEAVARDAATGGANFSRIHRSVRDWLLKALRADATLTPRERAEAGNALARLGDPRDEVMTLEGMRFCYVPKGPFWMGEGKDKEHLNEHLDDDYWIAQYPVTVAQYKQFVQGSGHTPKDPDCLRGLDNHPVVWVSWHEARAFCQWLTREWRTCGMLSGAWEVRLPSEAEWEKAARGGVQVPQAPLLRCPAEGWRGPVVAWRKNDPLQRSYPWGNKEDTNRANYDETGINATSAVGCFPGGASPYGVEELSGNVWEWTRSLWGKDFTKPEFGYPYAPEDGRENLEAGDEVFRVLRGGSWTVIKASPAAPTAAGPTRAPASTTSGFGW